MHIDGELLVRRHGKLVLDGVDPTKVLWMVDRSIMLKRFAEVGGTLFGAEHLSVGWNTKVEGVLIGRKDIKLLRLGNLTHRPFSGW